MNATTWNRKPRVPNPWRMAALEKGLDKDVALLIARYLPAIGVKARALTHVGIVDLMQKAFRMKD